MSFVTQTTVKAVRKRHRCDGCGQHIEIGQPAKRWAGMTDGGFGTAIYHPDCRAAEEALNDLLGWQWGDDWWALYDIDSGDRPWLIEAFPAVAARMGITLAPEPASRDTSVLAGGSEQQNPTPGEVEPTPETKGVEP